MVIFLRNLLHWHQIKCYEIFQLTRWGKFSKLDFFQLTKWGKFSELDLCRLKNGEMEFSRNPHEWLVKLGFCFIGHNFKEKLWKIASFDQRPATYEFLASNSNLLRNADKTILIFTVTLLHYLDFFAVAMFILRFDSCLSVIVVLKSRSTFYGGFQKPINFLGIQNWNSCPNQLKFGFSFICQVFFILFYSGQYRQSDFL